MRWTGRGRFRDKEADGEVDFFPPAVCWLLAFISLCITTVVIVKMCMSPDSGFTLWTPHGTVQSTPGSSDQTKNGQTANSERVPRSSDQAKNGKTEKNKSTPSSDQAKNGGAANNESTPRSSDQAKNGDTAKSVEQKSPDPPPADTPNTNPPVDPPSSVAKIDPVPIPRPKPWSGNFYVALYAQGDGDRYLVAVPCDPSVNKLPRACFVDESERRKEKYIVYRSKY